MADDKPWPTGSPVLKTTVQTGRDNPGWVGRQELTAEPVPLAGSLMKLTELGLQNRQMICTFIPVTKKTQFQERKEVQASV